MGKENTLKGQKKYKKIVLHEQSDSEPEEEEDQCACENEIVKQEKPEQKQRQP